METSKVGLLLCGEKAFASLSSLSMKLIHKVDFIVGDRDPGVVKDFYTEIENWAYQYQIEFFDKTNKSIPNPKYWVAIGWKWLIPINSNYKVITIHDSLLPKYRGFNPLVTALIEGDQEIGATVFWSSEKPDEGPILFQERVEISYPIKISEAIVYMSEVYGVLLSKILEQIESLGPGITQDEKLSSYSLWRDETDYWINWSWTANKILRHIHSSGTPYSGTQTLYDNKIIKIFDARLVPDKNVINRSPGKIFNLNNNSPLIICGEGILELTQVQDLKGLPVLFSKLKSRLGRNHLDY